VNDDADVRIVFDRIWARRRASARVALAPQSTPIIAAAASAGTRPQSTAQTSAAAMSRPGTMTAYEEPTASRKSVGDLDSCIG
jgi:hypothetical protein